MSRRSPGLHVDATPGAVLPESPMHMAGGAVAEEIRDQLVRALMLAQQAVSADTEGDKDTALRLYGEASGVLEAVLPFVPAEHSGVMAKYSGMYSDRASELRNQRLERSGDAGVVVPAFSIHFTEKTLPPPPQPGEGVPGTIRRPFWLMRQLSLSMQTGAYFTAAIYVSRQVWYQNGAHTVVRAVPAKVRYCERLIELLEKLDSGAADAAALVKRIDTFTQEAEALLKQLHREMPKGEQPGQEKEPAEPPAGSHSKVDRAWAALRSRIDRKSSLEPSAMYNSYIPWLVNVFEAVQKVDRWIVHFSQPEHGSDAVTQRLYKLSSHLYFGPCAFVLRDMFLLLQRWMKKSRESYSRLFPHSFQVGKA